MANLSNTEKLKLEKLFEMGGGYVLNFSNRTFREFFSESLNIDIYHSKYHYESGSKANRLRAFWRLESNEIVGKSILAMLEHWKLLKELDAQIISLSESNLYDESINIAERLIENRSFSSQVEQEIEARKRREQEASREKQLSKLLEMFDKLASMNDHQRRGILLEDLLNKLFKIHEIPVRNSFRRNDGGEQIDGAFFYQGWFYKVECKWTYKLAGIRELDSLSGKVNRSGKQSMGLFLSIEGWSENVPYLLKQNPDKSIILMEGYDLRCVLSGYITLEKLLDAKIAKLNDDSEPYLSAKDILG